MNFRIESVIDQSAERALQSVYEHIEKTCRQYIEAMHGVDFTNELERALRRVQQMETENSDLKLALKVATEGLGKFRGCTMPSASTGAYCTADITQPADEALARIGEIMRRLT